MSAPSPTPRLTIYRALRILTGQPLKFGDPLQIEARQFAEVYAEARETLFRLRADCPENNDCDCPTLQLLRRLDSLDVDELEAIANHQTTCCELPEDDE